MTNDYELKRLRDAYLLAQFEQGEEELRRACTREDAAIRWLVIAVVAFVVVDLGFFVASLVL